MSDSCWQGVNTSIFSRYAESRRTPLSRQGEYTTEARVKEGWLVFARHFSMIHPEKRT
jgi:hypothetical protein